jgi:hypothetical protein
VPANILRTSTTPSTVILVLLSLAHTVGALTLSAQSRTRPAAVSHTALIRGIVRDSIGFPVDGATVVIAPGGAAYRTDTSGMFIARRLPAGRLTISVRRLGFAPLRSSALLKAGDEVRINLVMRRLPQLLPEVKIAENECQRFAIEGIQCRRKRGAGVFMNREEVRANTNLVNLLLKVVSGFQPDSGESAMGTQSPLGASCWGLIVDGGFPISSRPIRGVEEVYAIEVFHPPDFPPEFEHWARTLPGRNGETPCALVVMWSMAEAQRSLR